jgi:hypothetical protein
MRPLVIGGVFGAAALWLAWPWARGRTIAAAAIAAWSVLVLCAYARTASPEFIPTSDVAVIESYTMFAAEGRLFVGPYSRFGWHHPGPALFYLLAPFHQLAGERSAGLSAGALVINLAAIFVITSIVARAAGVSLTLFVAVLSLTFVWRASEMLSSQWNPHVLVLPAMAFLVLCGEMAAGRLWRLPLVAVLGSLIVQTHVGLVPVVFAVGAAASAAAVAAAYRDRTDRRTFGRIVNVTAWMLLAAWLLPLAEEIYRTPGNLTELWRFFAGEERSGQTFRLAWRAWADMLSALVLPDFRVAWGSLFTASGGVWTSLLALAQMLLLPAIAIREYRARQPFRASLAGLLLLASFVALWSVTRIEDELYDHAVFWIAGIGVLNMAVILDAVAGPWVRAGAARLSSIRLTPALIGIAVVAVGAALGVRQLTVTVERSRAPNPEQLTARRLADQVEEYLRIHGGCKPLIRLDHPTWPVAAGLLLELQRDAVPYAVEESWLPMFSDAAGPQGDETCVMTIVWPQERLRLEKETGHEPIAERDRFTVFLSRMAP